jgi:hypothetical protein
LLTDRGNAAAREEERPKPQPDQPMATDGTRAPPRGLSPYIRLTLAPSPEEITMEYTRLGNAGMKVSRLALGCMSYGDNTSTGEHRWALGDAAAQPFLRQAVETGITLWDTANVYQHGTSEELVGRATRAYNQPGTCKYILGKNWVVTNGVSCGKVISVGSN